MLRFTSIFAVLILSVQVFAQSDEYKEAWQKTGYGIEELYSEPDFNPEECQKTQTLFVACMMTLQDMLTSFDEPKKLAVGASGELSVVADPDKIAKFETYDEYLAHQKELRDSYSLSYKNKAFGELSSLFDEVKNLSLENVPASDQAALAGSAYGTFLQTAYDPRTTFIPEELTKPKPNKYFGIGARIHKYEAKDNSKLKGALALDPMVGSPAMASGINKGDLILAVDGKDVKDETVNESVARIKGEEGSKVSLKIQSLCDNKVKTVTVTRGPITDFPNWLEDSHFVSLNKESSDAVDNACGTPSEEPKEGEPQALYVPLTTFVAQSGQSICNDFFQLQIKDLENPDSIGMILDLRGNGGGHLHEVSCMLDSIISAAGTVVGRVTVRKGKVTGKKAEKMFEFHREGPLQSGNGERVHYNKKIVVLIDAGSASASEIFSGTIQDMQRGWVVGDKSVGKGTMQAPRPHRVAPELSSSSDTKIMLSRTTGIYTLNSGRSPQGFGIIPDFRFDNKGEAIVDEKGDLSTEAKSFNSLKFKNNKWEQTRPGELAEVSSCAMASDSISENFKKDAEDDERYQRPFVSNYQMDLAKDVLLCGKERPEVL